MTPHNNAKIEDIAKTVLMPGDPLRAKFIAENFLENPRLVNNVRNVFAYTGTYKGVPVTVMASGMGMASIGIYSYELYKFYGVENIVRIGSAGSYVDELKVHDVVLSSEAFSDSTYAEVQNGCMDKRLLPSSELNEVVLRKAAELGINCKLARVHSSDCFYTDPSMGGYEQLRERTQTDCVEMEAFALFANANYLGKRATCLLTISDSFTHKIAISAEERQNSFTTMMRLALESAIAF